MANLIRRRSSSPSLAAGRHADQPLVTWEDLVSPRRLRRDIDRLVDEVFSGAVGPLLAATEFVPSLELTESENEYVMTAELPGMTEKDVHIEVDDNNVLTIRGEKRSETAESRGGCEFSERSYGQFVRTIQLPANVEANKIEARMQNGVLELHIPKTAQANVRAIPIGKQEPKQMPEAGTAKSEKAGGEKAGAAKAPERQQQEATPR